MFLEAIPVTFIEPVGRQDRVLFSYIHIEVDRDHSCPTTNFCNI